MLATPAIPLDVARNTHHASNDPRAGKNGRHGLAGFLRQSVFSRLAGYEDVNDADRLCRDPATLATPDEIETWSLTSLRERLIKTGARLLRHARYAIFQMAEAALPRRVFANILERIKGLRDPPAAAVSV